MSEKQRWRTNSNCSRPLLHQACGSSRGIVLAYSVCVSRIDYQLTGRRRAKLSSFGSLGCATSRRMSGGPGLEPLVDQMISVITNDGRHIVGMLRGFDQATNLILDESHERVYSTQQGVEDIVLGLYIIRGDNISIIGELDAELDESINRKVLRGHPLKPVIH
ncbi:Sm-like protein [Drosera capensis]